MAFTRPRASQINFDTTNITDTLIRINSSESGDNANDLGIIFERGNHTNAAIVWDESADAFRFISTTHDASTTTSDINISAHHSLHVGGLAATGTLTVSGAVNFDDTTGSTSTTTGALIVDGGVGIAENLYVGGTIDMDRLSLTSSQTTVPPLQLTANSLNDGVGALRIDGSQADIFLNPSTATHTTITFAVNNDQRLAFGMDNNSDFYITRRTGGSWYDDTFVIDRDTGLLSLGYDFSVAGDATITGNLTVNGTTTTISTTNSVVSDSLIELNTGATSNANDLGFIFERGSTGDNAAIIWDESADVFVLGTTTATGDSTGNLTFTTGELRLDTLRIDQNGSGLRMTNVGAFDNDGSDNFRIFATNDLQIKANGDSGGGLTIDVTNNDVTIDNDLRVSAGQFYYGGIAVTSTATELNYVDGVTSNIQTQIDNISSSFTLAADSGTPDTFTTGQTLTIAGGTGIDTTVSDNNISIAIDSTVATLTDTQTLTNKTLTSPQVNTEAKMLAQAELEFYDSDSSNYVSFRGPATVATNITWTLPNTDGTEGQVLSTNGAGTLAWADAGSGGGGSGSSYPNSTFSTVPGTDGNFDMSYNVAQTSQETPFEDGGTDAFGVNLGSVFSCMDPIGTTESIDYADGEAYVGA